MAKKTRKIIALALFLLVIINSFFIPAGISADETDTIYVTVTLSQVGGDVILDSTVLRSIPVRVVAIVTAPTDVQDVQAVLNMPTGFTFLKGYSRTISIGNLSELETRQIEWYVSPPMMLGEYDYNISFAYEMESVDGLVNPVVVDGTMSYEEWNDTSVEIFPSCESSMYYDAVRVKYDANYLYFYGEVYEFDVDVDDSNFMICIDKDNNGGTAPQTDDLKYIINEDGTLSAYQGTGTDWNTTTTSAVCENMGTGMADTHWTFELRIPIAEVGTPVEDDAQSMLFYTYDGSSTSAHVSGGDPDVPNTWQEYSYLAIDDAYTNLFNTDYGTLDVVSISDVSNSSALDSNVDSYDNQLTCYSTIDFSETLNIVRKGENIYIEGIPLDEDTEYVSNVVIPCVLHFVKNDTSIYSVSADGVIENNKIRIKATIPNDNALPLDTYSIILEAKDPVTNDIYLGETLSTTLKVLASISESTVDTIPFTGQIMDTPFSIRAGENFSIGYKFRTTIGSGVYYYPYEFQIKILDTSRNIIMTRQIQVNLKKGEDAYIQETYVLDMDVNGGLEGEISIILETDEGIYLLDEYDSIPCLPYESQGVLDDIMLSFKDIGENIHKLNTTTLLLIVGMFIIIISVLVYLMASNSAMSSRVEYLQKFQKDASFGKPKLTFRQK